MMQEQEIVRLEMKLKEEEYERTNLSQQLDQHRRTIIEKDKICLKNQGEIYILKERIAQLEESNLQYKNDSDINHRKARESDQLMLDLKAELKSLQRTNEDSMIDLKNVTLQIRLLEKEKKTLLEEKNSHDIESTELKKKVDEILKRFVIIFSNGYNFSTIFFLILFLQ